MNFGGTIAILKLCIFLIFAEHVQLCLLGNSKSLRRRYDDLQAGVVQQRERLLEAKARRLAFDNALEAFSPQLAQLEARLDDVMAEEGSQSGKTQEVIEVVKVRCVRGEGGRGGGREVLPQFSLVC